MKVLAADKMEQAGVDGLTALGCDVQVDTDLKEDALKAALASSGAEVLVVRSTKVTAEMLQASSLKLVIRAGSGYNTIDTDAATTQGISVANCPGMNSIAVAELALALMLAVDRSVPDCVSDLRQGVWNKKKYSKGRGLFGQVLGIVGFGNIGLEVAKRAKAFGMKVIVFSRSAQDSTLQKQGLERVESTMELASRADIVSLHVAIRPETTGLVDKAFLDAMKDGSVLINTSRAGVVVEADLIEAVKSGKIRAGLDVFEDEPSFGTGEYSGALKNLEGVYCTHHIGASTAQAQAAVAEEVVRVVKQFKATGEVLNLVNRAQATKA